MSSFGPGRLDLYDAERNQYYEVKHRPQHSAFLASDQKKKYDSSTIVGKMFTGYHFDESPTPGTRTDIYGRFEYLYFDITYRSHGNGVVTYEWELNKARYQQVLALAATAAYAGAASRMMGGNHRYQLAKDTL